MTIGKGELARLTWDHLKGAVVLHDDLRFRAEIDNDEHKTILEMAAAVADMRTAGYKYSPAHGWPGVKLAMEAAAVLGAKLELPKYPPPDPNVVY